GSAHALRGRSGVGLVLAFWWVFLLAVAVVRRDRIVGVFTANITPIDGLVAVATLALGLGGILAWTLWDLAVRQARPKKLKGDSQWAIAARHFKKNRMAIAGLAVMIFLYVVTLLTPLIAPFDPAAQG